ncbi:MAG: ornithine carbamoyltransferase [Nitrospirae bacterium]|nr:MAG: ornithine carbamoyltransferase [Nitrospirota bacterium]
MKRDFLTIFDVLPDEFTGLIKRAIDLKSGKDANKCPLIGKSVGLFFEKPSTRTRVSFEVGIYQLGGQTIYMNPKEIQLGRGETIADTAKVLSRYLSAIVLRTYTHSAVVDFAKHAAVPVINGLSDMHHPCQALADLMTILEKKGRLEGVRMAFIGDGNNVANSLIEAAAFTGIELAIACPEGFEPNAEIIDYARGKYKSNITVVRRPEEAAGMADVIYTDVWVSMGQEEGAEKKKEKFRNYQINSGLLKHAKEDATILHCLPAYRGSEITDEVMDGPHSAVFDQAENRLHTEKALLEFLIT